MIHNEREYKISKRLLIQLESAQNNDVKNQVPEWVITAQKNALHSQIEEIRENISEYEELKSNRDYIWECPNLKDLPKYLIKARIASGLSQKDLASLLSLKPQQIQRYESEYYKGANLNRLIDVASAVGLTVSGLIERNSQPTEIGHVTAPDITSDPNNFPIKEMIKRGWVSSKENIQDFISQNMGNHLSFALHRKKVYGKNKPNQYSLLAWQSRVLQKAKIIHDSEDIRDFHLDDSWIKEFVDLTKQESSPIAARNYLATKGIILVTEKHLDKTYLDGAAMMSDTGNPVIGLTLRHDRLDNFWFVLMHELGHIFKHIFQGRNMDFFDEADTPDGDTIEREADQFALNNLIPIESWNMCISRFTMTEDAVLTDAKRLNISPAIIAGRLRKESGNYYLLSELVGSGTVRSSLREYFE